MFSLISLLSIPSDSLVFPRLSFSSLLFLTLRSPSSTNFILFFSYSVSPCHSFLATSFSFLFSFPSPPLPFLWTLKHLLIPYPSISLPFFFPLLFPLHPSLSLHFLLFSPFPSHLSFPPVICSIYPFLFLCTPPLQSLPSPSTFLALYPFSYASYPPIPCLSLPFHTLNIP